MKILKNTLELAVATAKESETPLWLVGDRGVITDVVIAFGDGSERCLIPFGMHRYGKVVTRGDPFREQGCNLIVEDNEWHFVDDCGDPYSVEVIDPAEEKSLKK